MPKSIACVFVTYKHPDVVEQLIPLYYDSYIQREIDIYYYDSSPDNKTETIVKSYIEKGYDHLHYVDVRFTNTPDEKLVCLYNGYGLIKEYDYIWNVKDRCFFRENALDQICEACENDYDVVMGVTEADRWELIIPNIQPVYNDPVLFFSHYGQLCTNWECIIRKRTTMIDTIDWSFYLNGNELKKDNGFLQVMTLFNNIAIMDKFRIRVLQINPNDKCYSKLANSEWKSIVFHQWIDLWVEMINNLPSIYDPYKLSIIQSETRLQALFGSYDHIMVRRENGVLTKEVFDKYRSIWPMISDIPVEHVDKLLNYEDEEVLMSLVNDFNTSLYNEDYAKAYVIFINNNWFKFLYDDDKYSKLDTIFKLYKYQMQQERQSSIFQGIHTINDIIERYDSMS